MIGPRILVLDDDASLLRSVRLILVLEGFEVITAADGVEGLERIESEAFDVIILDLQMPRMDGRTFYRELRSKGHTTPVLILSANGATTARAELQAEGAITKPFDPDFLVSQVRALLPSEAAS